MTTTTEPSLLRYLRAMDNYAFEMLVADVWEGFGYETTVSQESNDKVSMSWQYIERLANG